jgi:hypothetical protein
MAFVEAVAASVAAVFAGLQIHFSRRDANSRAVFEHLREIDQRVQALWADDTQRAQAELLAFYRREREDLTDGARRYMSLLNSLDMLALAVEKRLVDKRTVSEHVQTLLQPHLVSQTFLRELQNCCGDEAVYEHLYRFFTTAKQSSNQLGRPP